MEASVFVLSAVYTVFCKLKTDLTPVKRVNLPKLRNGNFITEMSCSMQLLSFLSI